MATRTAAASPHRQHGGPVVWQVCDWIGRTPHAQLLCQPDPCSPGLTPPAPMADSHAAKAHASRPCRRPMRQPPSPSLSVTPPRTSSRRCRRSVHTAGKPAKYGSERSALGASLSDRSTPMAALLLQSARLACGRKPVKALNVHNEGFVNFWNWGQRVCTWLRESRLASQLTLLQVLHVLGGQRDADPVQRRAVILHAGLTHGFRHLRGDDIQWATSVQRLSQGAAASCLHHTLLVPPNRGHAKVSTSQAARPGNTEDGRRGRLRVPVAQSRPDALHPRARFTPTQVHTLCPTWCERCERFAGPDGQQLSATPARSSPATLAAATAAAAAAAAAEAAAATTSAEAVRAAGAAVAPVQWVLWFEGRGATETLLSAACHACVRNALVRSLRPSTDRAS
eukprot:365072-Chlamydomonas_euryale.AAC.3